MLFRDKRGNVAVYLLASIIVLTLITALVSEYMRVSAMIDRVEAQLIQAANVSLEEAMIDSYRIDERGGVKEGDARENLRIFLTQEIGLTAANQLLAPDGSLIYSLNNMRITVTGEPPRIEITCTLVIPSIVNMFRAADVPMTIRTRNVRLH